MNPDKNLIPFPFVSALFWFRVREKVRICGWNFGTEIIPGADCVRVTPIYCDWCITLPLSKNYTTLLSLWQFRGHHRKWSDEWEWKVKLVGNFWFVNEFHIALNQATHQRLWGGSSALLQVNEEYDFNRPKHVHIFCTYAHSSNMKNWILNERKKEKNDCWLKLIFI